MSAKSYPNNVIALHKQIAWEKYGRELRGKTQPRRRREAATRAYEGDRKGVQDALQAD